MLKADITVALVERLVSAQFPQWAGLPVMPVELDGWDNTTFRLGTDMAVRLPSADPYVAQVAKEQRWLPVLGPLLPVATPAPLALGEPSADFPRPWSVYRWIDGVTPTGDAIPDLSTLAGELAGFLAALYRCPPDGPPPGDHSFSRGGPVAIWDAQVRELVGKLADVLDARAALTVWSAALDADHDGPDVWVHGDVTGANLVVRDGRLVGVIDFGCSAVGDPACDLTVAWTLFDGESRRAFRAGVPVEPSTWARARGWALWKALLHLAADQVKPGRGQRLDRRVGWRLSARQIVEELLRDADVDPTAGHTARAAGAGTGGTARDPVRAGAAGEPGPVRDRVRTNAAGKARAAGAAEENRVGAPATRDGGRGVVEDASPRLVLSEAVPPAHVRLFAHSHLPGVLRLCKAEGWPSLPTDPARAARVLTAPGVTTVVALDGDEVTGFAQLFSDGELQAFLACLVVAEVHRGEGLGRALVEEALRAAGGERIDLHSEAGAVGFYEAFPHQRKPGFRLYPFYR